MTLPVGKVYLIPCPLYPQAWQSLPPYIAETVRKIRVFFVEELRTARRFLKGLDPSGNLEDLTFSLVNEHQPADLELASRCWKQGQDIGILSEAGCPGVADPGQELVAAAHLQGIRVIPLVGPNAVLLALMASGLNGQQFSFRGYIPVKEPGRRDLLKEMAQTAFQTGTTQIFMETPYRNNNLLTQILRECRRDILLCIASDLTGPGEFIHTAGLETWAIAPPDFHKKPAIFLLGRPARHHS